MLCILCFSDFVVARIARILLPGHLFRLWSYMSCHNCIYVAGLIQAGRLLPQGMFFYCCSSCTDDCVLCSFICHTVFVLGGLLLWAGGSPLVVRVSPDCLFVQGNSANLVWGMAYRMSSVRSIG